MRRFTRPPATLFHHEHRFSDPHLRSRAELSVIADHHRDLAAHASSADLAPAPDTRRIKRADAGAPAHHAPARRVNRARRWRTSRTSTSREPRPGVGEVMPELGR